MALTGAIIGGALGGIVGYLVGKDIDEQRAEQCKIALQEEMVIVFGDIKGGEIDGGDNESPKADVVAIIEPKAKEDNSKKKEKKDVAYFKANSSEMTPEFKQKLLKFAKTYKKNSSEKKILIIGHTDDTGNAKTNQKISEERAKAVAQVFKEAGVKEESLFYRGEGEAQPIADNNNPEGRALNRRVEIATFKTAEQMESATQLRTAQPKYYSNSAKSHNQTIASSTKKTKIAKEAPNNKVSTATTDGFDFGGQPIKSATPIGAKIGMPREDLKWYNQIPLLGSISSAAKNFPVTKAYASMKKPDWIAYRSCIADTPPLAQTKSLKDGQKISISDYRPGLEHTKWAGQSGAATATLYGIAVLMNDGAKIDSSPKISISSLNDTNAKNYTASVKVKTFDGEKGLLYRIFVDSKDAPIICGDILFPTNRVQIFTADGQLCYSKNGQPMVGGATFIRDLKSR